MNNINNSKILSERGYGLEVNKPLIFRKKSNLEYKTKSLRYVIADNGQIRHFPPSVQEWCNSIYGYDKNYSKLLPAWDKNLMDLLKSYYSTYSGKNFFKRLKIFKTRHKKKRFRRLSINKIFVGKGHLKHVGNEVIITWYIHSRLEKNFIKRKLKNLSLSLFSPTDKFSTKDKEKFLERITRRHIENKKQKNKNRKLRIMDSLYSTTYGDISNMRNEIIEKQFKEKITFNRPFLGSEFFKCLQRFYTPKQYKIRELLLKKNLINLELFFTWWLICLPSIENLNLNMERNNIFYNKINDIKKIILFLKENNFSYEDNLIILNKNYYLKKYLIIKYSLKLNIIKSSLNIFTEKLKYLINKIYNKKVKFKLIKLKRLYLSSDIFTQAIALRLKNRNNRLYRVIKSSLSKIKLSSLIPMTEKYKKIKINKESILINKIRNKKANFMSIYDNSIDPFKSLYTNIIPKLILKTKKELKCWTMTDINPGIIKHRYMAGIKIEAKGRLTRRFTASRSVFKMRQKGGFKNIDSSFRGLSAVILRGHVKSNGQYSMLSSKRRIGAFGIKGWVSNK